MADRKNKISAVWPPLALLHSLHVARTLGGALAITSLFAGAVLYPEYAMAQGESVQSSALNPESGLVVTPFVSLETLYDSNIFASTSQRESDTILRLSPGIGVGYHSTHSTFDFLYTFDSERYSRHSGLNTWQARQTGLIGGTYDFTDRFTGGLSANYLETYYPGELAPVTGVSLERTRATRTSVRPSARYRFSPRTYTDLFYDRAREHVAGGVTTYISTASAALVNDLTRRDRFTFQYQAYWYDFSTGTSPMSRVFTIGWRHNVTRETALFLVAGPRDTDGRTIADIYAAVKHDTPNASQTLAYTRSQLTFAGQTGVYDTHSWVAIFGFRPTTRWSISLEPGYYSVSQGNQEAKAYSLGVAGRYWFARDWSLALNYNYSRQHGILGTGNDALILRNVIGLSLTWALPSGPGHASLPYRQIFQTPATENGR